MFRVSPADTAPGIRQTRELFGRLRETAAKVLRTQRDAAASPGHRENFGLSLR